jgi:hypothetical protein
MTTDLTKLKPALARVTRAAGASPDEGLGSAFYIGDGYVLSALHVLADMRSNPPVPYVARPHLQFVAAAHATDAEIIHMDPVNDWVLLKCVAAPDVAPVERGPAPKVGDAWMSFGFPAINSNGMTAGGEVRDPEASDALDDGTGRMRAVQLYCVEAAAGQGAPMNGYSGGPCMVGDKAVGILRSTLRTSSLGGDGGAQDNTNAGTCFACPAQVVVDGLTALDLPVLPGGWSDPRDDSGFVLVLTDSTSDSGSSLVSVAADAEVLLPHLGLGVPTIIHAADAAASTADLEVAVARLCGARLAVFDATGFDPAVMLLLGIRAAARRGVTLLSMGGDYVLGDQIRVPFNLQDANIVSHSEGQEEAADPEMRPVALLKTRIERALTAVVSPRYSDLPVYEAVRLLPVERRGIRPAESGVLVLCPFAANYLSHNWEKCLKRALTHQWEALKVKRPPDQAEPLLGVARSFELNSPQLVSRAIYEEMRRAQCCVVDLTDWAPTVLFELGVRLAVSPHATACLIERSSVAAPETLSPVQRTLLALLVPDALRYDASLGFRKEPAFARAYGTECLLMAGGVTGGGLYRCVEQHLPVAEEPAAVPVYRELLDSARFFSRLAPAGGRTKPVGLFPGNLALTRLEEEADFERLLAAWLHMAYRHGEQAAQDLGDLGRALGEAMEGLYSRHFERLQTLDEALRDKLERMHDTWDETHT